MLLTAAVPSYGFEDWLALRDKGVVRQKMDYSCGAAALATVLTYFYLDPVSEGALLEKTLNDRASELDSGSPKKGLSFSDMAMLAESRDYPVVGVDIVYDDLKKLSLPVIVALQVEGRAHFSVLRKIDSQDRVFLADPSWGNRQLGREEFLRSFVREGGVSRGRILIVGSKDDNGGRDAFRHRSPRRILIAPGQWSGLRVP
ncbi:MAG: putative double-glycine peptidase [Glaciecola sp.]|jgi:predicted double-glycine peptidase|uniref:C39 family peptidase n=1 Tax=Congregibacter sp. TaxID=2744308 RepID=UPI0039E4BB08